MRKNLSDFETEAFLNANQDMVNCLTELDAIELGETEGFTTKFASVQGGDEHNPFKYMVLIKD